MTTDIVVPTLGESVSEATVAQWLKKPGDAVAVDDPLVELETDKVTLEVNASVAGVLSEVAAEEGANVEVGALLGRIAEGNGASAEAPVPKEAKPAEAAPPPPAAADAQSPAVRKMVAEHGLDAGKIEGTGKDGRLLKEDVQKAMATGPAPAKSTGPAPEKSTEAPPAAPTQETGAREERVRMTRLRKRIAERLKEAQNTAAMLTTFNEVDMGAVMDLRKRYRESFEKKHGVRLGMMSFFTSAAVAALKELPAVNGAIEGDEIVYRNYYNIGIAVSAPQGLVVPVLRNAETMGFADIEKNIGTLGRRARDGKLSMEDMSGGTFTITNGGVFGSLLSTPILNPPQSAILGMHKIQERPMAVDGEVKIRRMMYLALSYDHRLIDGREAVTFLVRIKDYIEDPERLLLNV